MANVIPDDLIKVDASRHPDVRVTAYGRQYKLHEIQLTRDEPTVFRDPKLSPFYPNMWTLTMRLEEPDELPPWLKLVEPKVPDNVVLGEN